MLCFASAIILGPPTSNLSKLCDEALKAELKTYIRSPEASASDEGGDLRIAARASDEGGDLRIAAILPQETAIGFDVCLVVAGVVSKPVAERLMEDVASKKSKVAAAKSKLDKARVDNRPESDLVQLEASVMQAEVELNRAQVEYLKPKTPVDLAIYFNGEKAPFTVKAGAITGPQLLVVPLSTPNDADSEGAKFWRRVARGVAWAELTDYGRRDVVLGLSRAESAATVPEKTSAPTTFRLYVFSIVPIVLGLTALALLVGSFCIYAVRTPLIRDNSLKVGDLVPGALRDAEQTAAKILADYELADAESRVEKAKALYVARANVKSIRDAIERAVPPNFLMMFDDLRASEDVLSRANAAVISATNAFAAAKAAREKVATDTLAGPSVASSNEIVAAVGQLATASKELEAANAAVVSGDEGATLKLDAATASLNAVKSELMNLSGLTRAKEELEIADESAKGQIEALIQKLEKWHTDLSELLAKEMSAMANLAEVESARETAIQDHAKKLRDNYPEDKAHRENRWIEERAVGTFSLGRAQMAFWLFLVVAGYIFIALSMGQIFGILNAEVLTLLGISGLTTVGSIIVTGTTAVGRLSQGFIRDILSTDGQPQVQRIQAVAFTLILGTVFVWVVGADFSFPKFDNTMLLLMGLANGLYVGLKVQEVNKSETTKVGGKDNERTAPTS